MLKANGHIAVWWYFVCVFLPCLYWLVIVDSWRDIIFLWWFLYVFVWTIKVTSEMAGWEDPRDGKKRKTEKWAKRDEKDWDEEEIIRLRSCWMMEKESKADWERRWKEVVLLVALKPPSVTCLFQSRCTQTGWDLMESRPLNSARNIIYKQAL